MILRTGSIGLNATVNHSSGTSYDEPDDDNYEGPQPGNRSRLNSTSRAESPPVFRPGGNCDRTHCNTDCEDTR